MREPSSQMMSKSNELQFYCLAEHSTKASLSKKKKAAFAEQSINLLTLESDYSSLISISNFRARTESISPKKKRIFLFFFFIFFEYWIMLRASGCAKVLRWKRNARWKLKGKVFLSLGFFFAACKSINWFPCFLPARISHSRGVRLEVCRCFYHGAM